MQRDCSTNMLCPTEHQLPLRRNLRARLVSLRAFLSDIDSYRPSKFPHLRPAPHLVNIFRQTAFCNRPEQLVHSPNLVQLLFATDAGSRTSRLLRTEFDEFATSPRWKP